MKTLRDVPVGESCVVKKLHGEGAVKRRIMDMGVTKNVEIYVRKVAPLGDPIEVTVRGYIDLYFATKDLTEDKRYVVFEDHLCKEGDNITHFDSSFNYVLKQEGFRYGLVDDMTNTIRYKGTTVFEFDLEQYNPEYKQSLEIEEEYEKQLKEDEERLSTDTDSEED